MIKWNIASCNSFYPFYDVEIAVNKVISDHNLIT